MRGVSFYLHPLMVYSDPVAYLKCHCPHTGLRMLWRVRHGSTQLPVIIQEHGILGLLIQVHLHQFFSCSGLYLILYAFLLDFWFTLVQDFRPYLSFSKFIHIMKLRASMLPVTTRQGFGLEVRKYLPKVVFWG